MHKKQRRKNTKSTEVWRGVILINKNKDTLNKELNIFCIPNPLVKN